MFTTSLVSSVTLVKPLHLSLPGGDDDDNDTQHEVISEGELVDRKPAPPVLSRVVSGTQEAAHAGCWVDGLSALSHGSSPGRERTLHPFWKVEQARVPKANCVNAPIFTSVGLYLKSQSWSSLVA